MRKALSVFALSVVLVLNGCATPRQRGASMAKVAHIEYNKHLCDGEREQLLLNVVRARSGCAPYFLRVSQVVSSLTLESNSGLTSNFTRGNGLDGNELVGGLKFVEQPTVTYVPLQGNVFANRLLTVIGLDKISQLATTGVSISDLFLMTVSSFGANDRSDIAEFNTFLDCFVEQTPVPIEPIVYKSGKSKTLLVVRPRLGRNRMALLEVLLGKSTTSKIFDFHKFTKLGNVEVAFAPYPDGIHTKKQLAEALRKLQNDKLKEFVIPTIVDENDTSKSKALGVWFKEKKRRLIFSLKLHSFSQVLRHASIDILTSKHRVPRAPVGVFHEGEYHYIAPGDRDSIDLFNLLQTMFELTAVDPPKAPAPKVVINAR